MLLGWTQDQLAEQSGVGLRTIRRLEKSAQDFDRLKLSTKTAIFKSLRAQNIKFVNKRQVYGVILASK